MPFVDLPADKVSLHYKCNTPSGDVSTLNPNKPTIIMLHALFLDINFLPQYHDPRLAGYNIIAIDFRSSGRTKAPVSALHDTNVLAADIAFFHDILKLPPCHIFAAQNSALNSAMRLALLWPEKVLSLTLCGIPSPTDEEWVAKAYNELMTLWSFAPDLETFEEAIVELSYFMFNSDIPPDLADEVAAHWQIHYAPCHRTRTFDIGAIVFGRVPLTPEELAQIKQPVLILQGERSAVYPVIHAENLRDQLVNAQDGAKLVVIKGGGDCLSILPAFTGRIGKIFSEFLSRLPPPPPPSSIPQKKTKERMRAALARQAELTGDNKYLTREWRSSFSFSRVTPEAKAATEQALAFFGQGEKQALSCLGKNGQPIRKFSERHHSQWFGAGQTIVRSSSVSDNGHHIEPNSSIKA